jgi:uncharacterized protein YqgV (UPF0045/DUF77 family)
VSVLVAFSVTPLGVGESVGEIVAEAVRVVRDCGLPNKTDAMFTVIEGDSWGEVMAVVQRAVEAVKARSPRVSVALWRHGRNEPQNRISRTFFGQSGGLAADRCAKCSFGGVAVHREHHALKRTRLVLAHRVDHQPGRLVQRETANSSTESYQSQ